MMLKTFRCVFPAALALVCGLLLTPADAATPSLTADYIVAVVNQELVTAGEVNQRIDLLRRESARSGAKLPPEAELRKQVLDALVEERVLITYARENGPKVEESEVDRAVLSVAQQNQISVDELRKRMRNDGIDYNRFRGNLKDQLLVERVREREVQSRVRISDAEIDAFLEKRRESGPVELNIAQILIPVPDGASDAIVSEKKAAAEAAQARVAKGEAFDAVAREVSQDTNKARGGEIGLRPADRLPDAFVEQVRTLQSGQVSPSLLRSGAGFHLLKLIERRDGGSMSVTQTRARHILLRLTPQLSQQAAIKRLEDYKAQIESGRQTFEALAKAYSEDGSAPQGGDLGWVSPGAFVPEFEQAMNELKPLGPLSGPVVSRFGVHLIQVMERRSVKLDVKQMREQARAALREQKFDEAYQDWVRDLRAKAYVELREQPQ